MKNRESLYPGRVKLTPVDAANGIYDMVRADEPQDPGTPLNKKLLDYAVAACGVTAGTATAYTLDDEFGGFELVDGAKVNFRLHVASGENPTLNVNGTGAKALKTVLGDAMPSAIPAGMWVDARYSAVSDAYILTGGRVSAAQISAWDAKLDKSSAPNVITSQTLSGQTVQIALPQGYKVYRIVMIGYHSGGYMTVSTSNQGTAKIIYTNSNGDVTVESTSNSAIVVSSDQINVGAICAEIIVDRIGGNMRGTIMQTGDGQIKADFAQYVTSGGAYNYIELGNGLSGVHVTLEGII